MTEGSKNVTSLVPIAPSALSKPCVGQIITRGLQDLAVSDAATLSEFFEQVKKGNLAFAAMALGVDPRLAKATDDQNATPLHYAAEHGHSEIAELLLTCGANLHAKDKDDETPLGRLDGAVMLRNENGENTWSSTDRHRLVKDVFRREIERENHKALLKLNAYPLNQLCMSLLPQEDGLHEGYLYSLQLLIWGLENLELENSELQWDLKSAATQALSWKPINAQMLVFNPDDEGDVASQAMSKHEELKELDREDAALNLIEEFHSQMLNRNPGHYSQATED